jgi:hypothetical protein
MDNSTVIKAHNLGIRAVLKAQCDLEVARLELDRAYATLATVRRLHEAHKAGLAFVEPLPGLQPEADGSDPTLS